MSAGLFGGDTPAGVVGEQGVQQIQPVFIEVVDKVLVVVTGPFREGGLEVRQARDAGPDLLVGGAEGTVGVVRDGRQVVAGVAWWLLTGRS